MDEEEIDGLDDDGDGFRDEDPACPEKKLNSMEFTQAIQVLQSLEELQADLEGDGEPPVPMVSGKPAVMRVYFNEVSESTNFRVDVTGVTSGTRNVTLVPGCTPQKQRLQQDGCTSADFGFTPPIGSWTVEVSVSEGGGGVGWLRAARATPSTSPAWRLAP